MKNIITILLFIFSLTFTSCRQNLKKENYVPHDWVKLTLPNDWTLYAPESFHINELQGIDSEPGVINSNQDSIYLQFDNGTGILKKANCSFQNDVEKAKEGINKGFYKEFYRISSEHTANIDTLDNKVAVIVKPTKTGQGTVAISISDCETGKWLGITGTNLSLHKENIVLEIFKTIKLTTKQNN